MSFHALMILSSLSQCVIALSSRPLLLGGHHDLRQPDLLIQHPSTSATTADVRSLTCGRPVACRSCTGPARNVRTVLGSSDTRYIGTESVLTNFFKDVFTTCAVDEEIISTDLALLFPNQLHSVRCHFVWDG